jgi:predicted ATPase
LQNESKKAFRIALTGASGVGKTSLATALADKLQLAMIAELGRQICEERGFARIGDIPDQEGFKKDVLSAQIEKENELHSFVADRGTIDCWVLWQRWNLCSAMTYDSEEFYLTARNQAQKYSHVIYIPPLFEPVEDGFRWTEPDYVKQVDRLIRLTLYDWELLDRTFTITKADPAARLDETLEWLDT